MRRRWSWALAGVAAVGLFVACNDDDTADGGGSDGGGASGRGSGPVARRDHWHVAYGIFVCDSFLTPLGDKRGDALGIHSHGDGLVHVHPFFDRSAGENARVGLFFAEVGAEVTATSIRAGGQTVENGDDCGGQPGHVVVRR